MVILLCSSSPGVVAGDERAILANRETVQLIKVRFSPTPPFYEAIMELVIVFMFAVILLAMMWVSV